MTATADRGGGGTVPTPGVTTEAAWGERSALVRVLDLRLAPAAAGAWAVTIAALFQPPALTLGMSAGCAVLGGLALVLARAGPGASGVAAAGRLRHRLRTRTRTHRRRSVYDGVAVALFFAAAAAAVTGSRMAVRDASPLTAAAAAGRFVTVEMVLTDDPRRIASGWAGQDRLLVPARASAVQVGAQRWVVDVDIIVLADVAGWIDLLPSQRLTAAGPLLPARSGELSAGALAVRGPPQLIGGPSALQQAAGRLRAGLVRASDVLPSLPRGLLPGLVLGDTRGMDPVLVADFRTTGLTHLVAVSGANCAIVVGAVLWSLRRLGLSRLVLALVAGLALAGFVVLVRPSPSVLRAAAMGAVTLLALATGRPRAALPALAATVLVLVLVLPELAVAPGFGLSVAATAGIVLVAPGLTRRLRRRRVPPVVAEALAVSTAACLSTAPLIAALAAAVSLVSIPANLLAAPAVPAATVLGVLATLASVLPGPLAEILVWVAGWPTRWLVGVAQTGADVPGATASWPGGLGGGLLLTVALLGATVAGRRWPGVGRLLLAAACAAATVTVPGRVLAPGWPPAGWRFVACDVGQGDALVLAAGPATAVLVDAGPDPGRVDRCLHDLGVQRLALVVLSHLHADHVAGLPGALTGRAVDAVVVGPQPEATEAASRVAAQAAAAGVAVQQLAVGQRWALGDLQLAAIGPVAMAHGTRSDLNNASLVLDVTSGTLRLLMTGDIEIEAQHALLRAHPDLSADVLKVAHHGSAYQDEGFLDAVDAALAVVSVGADNDYGHPAPSLLTRLAALGMTVARTDLDGAVAVGGDQTAVWVAGRARSPPTPSLR